MDTRVYEDYKIKINGCGSLPPLIHENKSLENPKHVCKISFEIRTQILVYLSTYVFLISFDTFLLF